MRGIPPDPAPATITPVDVGPVMTGGVGVVTTNDRVLAILTGLVARITNVVDVKYVP
jgi:hypothetical protein